MSTEENDFALFRASMKGVRPIKNSGRITLPQTNPKPHRIQHQTENESVIDTLSDFEHLPPVNGDEPLHFVRPGGGVQQKILKRLKRGQLQIEGNLDLHGMKRNEAKQILLQFITWASYERLHVIRLVHGKGYGSAQHPVLKNKLNTWLRQCHEVLAYCSAQPKHGGSGALYVLLKISSPG